MIFSLDSKESYETRAIYTFWDLLGDVGGLYDMLKLLGQLIITCVQLYSGSNLNQYLVSHIFKKEANRRIRSNFTLIKWIGSRKPAKFKVSYWLTCWRGKKK